MTDKTRAQMLASVLSAAATKPGARSDAYFDTAGNNLLANLLLAAAVGQRPITDVYLWLTDPHDSAAGILERDGYDLQGPRSAEWSACRTSNVEASSSLANLASDHPLCLTDTALLN